MAGKQPLLCSLSLLPFRGVLSMRPHFPVGFLRFTRYGAETLTGLKRCRFDEDEEVDQTDSDEGICPKSGLFC